MRIPSLRSPSVLVAAVLGCAALTAHGDPLTSAYQTQLETWLGSTGPLQFTDIFSAANGDGKTSVNFHSAADGMGPTFTLASVTRGADTYLIGGYDPVSWSSVSDYVYATTTAEQDAFIFNLTTDVIQRENTFGTGQTGSGDYQTLDVSSLGPTFGQSFDIAIGNDYPGFGSDFLTMGATFNYSYGGSFGTDILGDADLFERGNLGIYDPFTVNTLDVYTFAPGTVTPPGGGGGSSVPEAGSTAAMMGLATAGLALLRPRRRLA